MKLPHLNLFKICILALFLRLVWAFLVPVIPLSDCHAYDVFAQNIWLHNTYGWTVDRPFAYWPVGTSALYSILYGLFGHTYWIVVGLNTVCMLGIIVFSTKLCDLLFDNKDIGPTVALILAVWPTLIFYTTILSSELPYMLASMAAIYYFIKNSHQMVLHSLLSGILFASAYYIRPLATITMSICILYLIIRKTGFKEIFIRSLICFVTLVILVAPWAYRNYQLYGHVVPMSTNAGATLWMGNQPGTSGGYLDLPDHVQGLNDYERNIVLRKEAIAYIKAEPMTFLTRTAKKLVKFHLMETIGITWNVKGIEKEFGTKTIIPLKVMGQLYWSFILLSALVGVCLYMKRKGWLQLILHPYFLIWLSTACIHAIVVAQDRYHIPIIPMVAAFAAYAMVTLKDQFTNRRINSTSTENKS